MGWNTSDRFLADLLGTRSVRLRTKAMEVARSVELHERLAPAPGSDLSAGHQDMAADRSTVSRPSGELALIEDRPGPGYHARAPLRVPPRVFPAVDGRRGQARALEGYVEEGEALVPSGRHRPTIAG